MGTGASGTSGSSPPVDPVAEGDDILGTADRIASGIDRPDHLGQLAL
jgi:hypothetical protein